MKKLVLVLAAALLFAACEQPAGPAVEPPAAFVAVTGIRGVPLGGKKSVVLNLAAAKVAPADATRQDIAWVLLDCGSTGLTEEDLADGRPAPRAAGTLKLRAVVAGGLGEGLDYTQDITVAIIDGALVEGFVAVTGITGVPLGGAKGAVLDLGAARVEPEDATQQLIDWMLLDDGSTGLTAAELEEGKPIPPEAGALRLLAVVAGGLGEGVAYTQEFIVTIADGIDTVPYSINIASLSKGSITADRESATAGTKIALTAAPEPGYALKADSLRVKNGTVEISGSDGAYSFVMPASNVTVTAEFEAILYTVTIDALINGSVAVNQTNAAAGVEITLTAAPDPGYALKAGTVRVNNGAVEASGSGLVYAFAMPAENVTVAAEFEALTEGIYTIGIGNILNGTINADPTRAHAGAAIALTVMPHAGYALKAGTVTVNGGAVTVSGSGGPYAFVMPAENVTASAEFEAIPYSIVIPDLLHGSIVADPAGATVGTLVALTVSPEAGYDLKAGTVKVNGGSVAVSGSGSAYTFVMPASDAAVSAEFEQIIYNVSIASATGGSVVANPASAAAGTTVALTVSPNGGRVLKAGSVKVNGGAVAVSGSGSAYTFVMPFSGVEVSAEFEAVLYSVTVNSMAHGSVIANPTRAAAGSAVILTVTPDPGYELKLGSLKVNNTAVSAGVSDSVYAFVMPAENAAVSAEFEQTLSRTLTNLEIGSPPDTLIYLPGEEFNPAGLVVYGVYSDGSREELVSTEFRIDTSKISGTGNQRVFIRKDGLDSVAILIYIDPTGRVLKSAVLATPPPAAQEMGKNFNTTGMVITGTYADGSTEQLNNTLCTVTGYDKWKRGTQRVALKINGIIIAADMEVNVRIPATASLQVADLNNQYHVISLKSYRPGDSFTYRPVYIKGMAFDLAKANLRPVATVNGGIVMLSWGNGLGPGDTVSGYNANAPGKQTLTMDLDDARGTFDIYLLDAEPHVYFDYGYMRHAGDLNGTGAGAGKYYARINETLILAPIRFLVGYDEESRDIGAAYSWSVTGGAYDTAAGTTGDAFAFTPKAAGTYTVTVSVTGRNFVTGQSDTKTAVTEVVCYTGALPAGTFASPLKNFSPGQFTEKGTGYGWSLGSALGYEVFSIAASSGFRVTGNAFGGWEEPGVVWVQEDRNGNGLPDEMWYELTGSDEDNPLTKPYITRRYAIKWFRFGDEAKENEYGQIIRTNCWVDNKGRAGILGGGWPYDWGVSGDWVVYTGTIIRDGQVNDILPPLTINFPQRLAGYVDCFKNGDQNYVFSKDVAIRADGSPANLEYIRFVKVQTGMFMYGGAFGETSTEIVSATGLGDQSGGFPNPLGSVNR
jgi:hypothetical protein